jgi:L-ascorbate metabolism protein UlaG (beta-lactamase superfamily)
MDPFDPKMVGLKMPKVSANVVTVSHQHSDHNQIDLVSGNPTVFSFPGEYEVGGIKIFGLRSYHDKLQGRERGENIIFKIIINDVRLTHLGDLGHSLDESLVEELEDTDVLLIPVGGTYTINPAEAKEVIDLIKPSVFIPMHYQTTQHNQSKFSELTKLDEFLRLYGREDIEPVSKFEIKTQADLPESELVVLKSG